MPNIQYGTSILLEVLRITTKKKSGSVMLQKMMEDPLLSSKTCTDSYRVCSSIHYI